MNKTLSIFAVALMVAGSTAFACGSCGCEAKKAEKSGCCKGEKKETAYNQADKADLLACGGSKKADKSKEAA